MIIFLSDEHKKDLEILHGVAVPVLVDFCKLSWDFVQNGPNIKKYHIAAQKLQVEDAFINNVVHALTFLLLEGCKYNLSENDFKMSLSIAGFPSEHQDILLKFYISRNGDLSEGLQKLHDPVATYQDLDWRFEVQIASKKSEDLQPNVTMDLVLKTAKSLHNPPDLSGNQSDLKRSLSSAPYSHQIISHSIDDANTASECENTVSHVIMNCDLPNLLNLSCKLEQALQESKSQHVRKIQRALQRK